MQYFKENPKGVIVSMDTEGSEIVYSIWYQYTKQDMKEIKVGSFIAIKNYNGVNGDHAFSILEIISAYPKHYALGSSARDTEKAFPGFVIEAAKNAKVDWEQEEPIEQTTKIKCEALSTGLQLIIPSRGEPVLKPEDSIPMVGEDAHILTDEQINKIVNKGLITSEIKTIEPCNLILNENVPVKLSTEDLLKTHFGVFGFTGSGKSNLLSGLIKHLTSNGEPNKIVLFDLMTEYTGLLIDLLNTHEHAYILSLTEDSLPGSKATEELMRGDNSKIEEVAKSIVKTLLLPKELIPFREKYVNIVKNILKSDKIKVFNTGSDKPSVSDFRAELSEQITGHVGTCGIHIGKMIENHLIGSGVDPITEEMLKNLKTDIEQGLLQNKLIDYTKIQGKEIETQQSLISNPRTTSERDIPLSNTGKTCLIKIQDIIKGILERPQKEPLPENKKMSLSEIYTLLNDKAKPALLIIQGSRDDDIRTFSEKLVTYSFNVRRISGEIFPHIAFLYDEADEFIPQNTTNDSYKASKFACTLLARRGRKFGLGLGIATQRVAYLDTSILAQPHTFLLSKLPRKYDRDTIGTAFGASDEMLNRTLSFQKGQWLLFSYDATGLTNVPLPVQFPNANKRIIEYLG